MAIKDTIIQASVALFNAKGFTNVTMKQIADEIGISPGNLTYHFKTKELLIENIYDVMHEEARDFLVKSGYITLHDFEVAMNDFYEFNQKYRFFFNDVVAITNQFKSVAKKYETSNLERFKQGRKLIDYYVQTGRMVPETEDISYNQLIHTVWMTMAFWTAQTSLLDNESYQVNKTTPVALIWNQMFPFLTEKGWSEYREMKTYSNYSKT